MYAHVYNGFVVVGDDHIHTSIEYWEKDETTIIDALIFHTTISDIGIKYKSDGGLYGEPQEYDLSDYIKNRGE
jgi:hypothetical protein